MPLSRRLTAALAAASLGWVTLAVGVGTPAAQAQSPAATRTGGQVAQRAPHDPATYYSGTDGLVGADLANRLHTIIRGHTRLSYDAVYDALPVTDRDQSDSARLIDFYSGTSMLISNRCGSGSCAGKWNREHTWPQSKGTLGTTAGPGTDLHHMRPEFFETNSSRGNLDFDDGGSTGVPLCALCKRDSDSFEPRDAVKGDLARGLLYMAVRYEGTDTFFTRNLKMNDQTCNESGPGNLGKLSTLVAWSLADPPDAGERARNDLVDGTYQGNRNPFIDHPEWVTTIYGDGVGLGPACGSTAGSDTLPGGGGTTNNPPTTAATVSASTPEDTAMTLALVASDADGDPVTWSVTATPDHGTAGLSGSTLTYTPAANYVGGDTVGVTVSDGRGGTARTTVSLSVTSVNDAPVTFDVAASTPRGTAKQVTLTGSDVDGDTLSYAVVMPPAHGTVTVNGSTATYTPADGYTGSDGFTYRASDPAGATSTTSTVSVTVATAGQTAPTASPLSVTTPEDESVVFPLTGSDPDNDPITFRIVTHPTRGSLNLSGDRATYTPARNYSGSDSFTFSVSDADASSAPATASITVSPVNDAPVASPASATTAEDTAATLTLSGTDADLDALTYAIAVQPEHGEVTGSGTQATYTPDADFHGSDVFAWTVSDGTATTTSSATITVTSVDDGPTAGDLTATTSEDGAVTVPLDGDDADGDPLTYALGTAAQHGTVEVTGATATYTPEAGWSGTDSFTYTASDGTRTSAAATVTLTVTPVGPFEAALQLATPAATRGTRVTTTVTATGPAGPMPTGEVTLTSGGTVVGTADLGPDGTATVPWTPTRAGSTELVASYAGDGVFGPSTSSPAGLAVARSAARTTFSTGTLRRGRPGVIRVSVRTVAGLAATGRITLTTGGRTFRSSLSRGTATFRIARLPRTARLKASARYPGDTQYASGFVTRTFTLRR